MNPNQSPLGPQREFTTEALEKKFSYSFSRKQLIILVNALNPIQLPIGDMRSKVLREILEEIQNTAIQSITESDYEPLGQTAMQVEAEVKTN